jgi:hypothetical protein
MLLAVGCSSPAPPAARTLRIEPLTLGAAEPSLAPQLTVTGDRALVSWIETQGRTSLLKFAERTATGWSEPRTAASGDTWFINWADVPSVFRTDSGTLIAHWLENTDVASEAYDLRLSMSRDDGQTWSAPASPHHDGTKTQHGFASLFHMTGGFGMVWLDGRAMADEGARRTDNMSLRSALFNGDGKQLNESLVDDRVCDCCPTAVATADGVPLVVFRDRSGDEVRDISIAQLLDARQGAWSPPRTVHDDGWKIEACPVNGAAIAARGRQVAVAWMTAKDDRGRAFAAFSSDRGATFGGPVRLDDNASQGRVGIALAADGSAVASWLEFANEQTELRIRSVEPSGTRGPALAVAGLAGGRASGYPRLVRRGDEVLLAWTETSDGRSVVRTAAVR